MSKLGYKFSSLASVCLIYLITSNGGSEAQNLNCTETIYSQKLLKIPRDHNSQQSTCRNHFERYLLLNSTERLNNVTLTLVLFHTLCNQNGCYQAVSDIIQSCFSDLKTPHVLACSSFGRLPCWSVPSFEMGENAEKLCTASSQGQSCSPQCTDELTRLKGLMGCCFNNVFNSSLFGMSLFNLGIADNSLWNRCGVSTLPYCPLTRTFLRIEYQLQSRIQILFPFSLPEWIIAFSTVSLFL